GRVRDDRGDHHARHLCPGCPLRGEPRFRPAAVRTDVPAAEERDAHARDLARCRGIAGIAGLGDIPRAADTDMSSAGVPGSLLAAVPGLEGRALKDLETLAAEAEQLELRRGEILVRQGDPSDTLYFVLSGRFAVRFEDAPERTAEIAQGQPIGEIGFFANLPRTATVVALRDSSVLAISRRQFQRISETSSALGDAGIASLATRLSQAVVPAVTAPAAVRTVALMAAGGSRSSDRFVSSLREVASRGSRVIFLTESDVATRLAGASFDDAACSSWLNSLEADADLIFYIADDALTDWTRKCIRQADALLLVAEAGAVTDLNPSETFAFTLHPSAARRLVILHQQRTNVASGTGSWLESRAVSMRHEAALQDTADVQRLFRFMSGRAVGFVAAGGGALGSAHLGVYKALCEAGADFDIFGGTSSGAAMAAALAAGAEPARVDEGTHNIFVKSRVFRRPPLPRYALIDHKAFDRALQAEFGEAMIEDIWKPFFAVSSNLSNHRPRIHRRGPVWHALRASGSIPGVLP